MTRRGSAGYLPSKPLDKVVPGPHSRVLIQHPKVDGRNSATRATSDRLRPAECDLTSCRAWRSEGTAQYATSVESRMLTVKGVKSA